jgi:hypothetical protein
VFLPHPQRTISPHNGAERSQSWLTCAGRIADCLPKCSNLDRGRLGTFYEIMRSRIRNFRDLVMQFARQYCAGTGDRWAFFWPARLQADDVGRQQPHHLIGTRKEND